MREKLIKNAIVVYLILLFLFAGCARALDHAYHAIPLEHRIDQDGTWTDESVSDAPREAYG